MNVWEHLSTKYVSNWKCEISFLRSILLFLSPKNHFNSWTKQDLKSHKETSHSLRCLHKQKETRPGLTTRNGWRAFLSKTFRSAMMWRACIQKRTDTIQTHQNLSKIFRNNRSLNMHNDAMWQIRTCAPNHSWIKLIMSNQLDWLGGSLSHSL